MSDRTRPDAHAFVPARRLLLLGGGLAGAGFWGGQRALAQAAAPTRDWFALIRQQHQQISHAFDVLLARDDQPWEQRSTQLRTVSQLLNAHQEAEENVVYPALTRVGLASQADHLYKEEADIKVLRAQLVLLASNKGAPREWTDVAHQLQKAVLEHALKDEEKDVLPQLHDKLDAGQNRFLSVMYPREFATVVPPRS